LKRKVTFKKKNQKNEDKKKTMHYKRKITWRVKLKRKINFNKRKKIKRMRTKKKKNNAL
jgi:hypothetical protein